MNENRHSLSKVLGRTDIIAIGFGTMVGWSWVIMAPSWINEAGVAGALAAFATGGLIILAVGMIYGELTAALPLAGGEFVFTYRAMGERISWLVGWVMALAYIGVAAWEGIALATAIDYMLPIPSAVPMWEIAGYQVCLSWAAVGMAGAAVITLLNLFGVRHAVLFQVMASAAIMIVVLIILFGGLVFGSSSNIGEAFVSYKGFSYVLLMVPAMLIGFDVIPQSAEEMNIGARNIGKMVLVCIVTSLIWYFILILGTSMAAPVEIRSSGIIPMAEIMSYLFNGDIFSAIIIIGGIFGILTSWNGFFIGATRLIFAMGRAGILPSVFGRLDRKYKAPRAAILLVGGICITAPLLGMNALVWFVDTSSLCALFSYIFVLISFIILKKKEPELARPLNVGGVGFGAAVLIVMCIYFAIYIYRNLIPGPEFIITLLWLLGGAVLYGVTKLCGEAVSDSRRELLVFGENFARKRGKNEK